MKFIDHSKTRLWRKALFNWKVAGVVVIGVLLTVIAYMCSGHHGIPERIHSWGPIGIIVAVLLMAAFHMTPLPSDGLLIMYFKVFGVVWGGLYGWVGSLVSALCLYGLARYLGQGVLRSSIPEKHFKQVDNWVLRKGQRGLFMARLLPIPAFAVNCVAGVMPSVRLWAYLWTAALSIVPYFCAVGLVYVGMSTPLRAWAFVGGAALVLMWVGSYALSGGNKLAQWRNLRTWFEKGRSRAS